MNRFNIVDIEAYPSGEPMETPLIQKRRRTWSPRPLPVEPTPPLTTHQLSPGSCRSLTEIVIETEPTEDPVTLPAMFVECGGSSTATFNDAPSSRPVRRPALRDDDIENCLLNLGSDPDSDEDVVAPVIPRTLRVMMETPEDDEEPQSPQQSSPLLSSPVATTPSSSSPTSVPVEPTDMFEFRWRSFSNSPMASAMRREVFSESIVGPTSPQTNPYEIFVRIWDRRFMENIASETNKYAQQLAEQLMESQVLHPSSRICDWKDTSAYELYVFFAIISAMGIVTKSRIVDYWSTNSNIFMTPGFQVYMSLRRFQLLCKCLLYRDNKDMYTQNLNRSEAKLFKIQPVIDHLNSVFRLSYNLQQSIALDESLLQWKGWLDINQFIPNKAAAVGIKTYEICESQTGYLWRFVVHAHKRTENTASIGNPLQSFIPSLVLELLKGLENKAHTVRMDNFYNSPALARTLKALRIDCVGTLRTNCQFVPQELTDLTKNKMRPGQIAGVTSGDIDLMVWRDRNRVATISTYHGNSTVTARGGSLNQPLSTTTT